MTKALPSSPDAAELGLTHSRYELQDQLGRGGMANVHRALDRVTGRVVALKLLTKRVERERSIVTTLFEREYHTLAQLRHPHVIEVYDYGVFADGTPFYTMELLDGGDVRQRAPIDWRTACSLFFEVCSSLALLHSRRLLHRDISPPNIRCTQSGHAKLIDFGAMSPMSAGGADVVGTPAFVAPETVHRLTLDARTDLYSLGATLYYALTGATPYPARSFAEVMAAWSGKVRAPSAVDPGIPPALDDLVLSLISVEPALRPQSAFDVMQLLAAIAELQPNESEAVPRAYLSTPVLVGREGLLEEFRHNLLASRLSRGRALLLKGSAGVGRSRMLDACSLEAKTLGFSVLRATATGAHQPFATAQRLFSHLQEAMPDESLAPSTAGAPNFQDSTLDAEQLQRDAVRYFWNQSAQRPLLFAVDDVHLIDPRSAAVLAGLLDKSARGRVFVLLSADADAPDNPGLSALARRCSSLQVEPLTKKQTRALFSSVFGEVANLDLLAQEVHAVSGGVPRVCMDIAQHLVDQGLIRYASGSWTLPSKLATRDLPQSAAEAVCARVAQLSAAARFAAEALALAFTERLSDAQFRLLLKAAGGEASENVLPELVASAVVLRQGSEYTLPNRLWVDALTSSLSETEARARHRALAELYRDKNRVAFIYHAFAGDLETDGLEAITELNAVYAKKLDLVRIYEDNIAKMVACYPLAIECSKRLGKSPRFINDLYRWYFAATLLEEAQLPECAHTFCATLQHDSGLDLYQSDPDTSDPMQRLMRALTGAQARYAATPESERCYSVEEAIRLLAEYVVIAIAWGGRAHDAGLMRSLPPLLEPFAPLSPLLDAIYNNAVASMLSQAEGAYSLARERWLEVIKKLDTCKSDESPFVDAISNAVAFGIGIMEGQLGLPTALSWAERLERDPTQHVSALQLRRVVRLQQGDTRGAERFRRQAELASLSSRMPQMFKSLLAVELTACANARDLMGIQDVIDRMRPVAERHVFWRPNLLYAEACFHLTRGDLAAAKAKCEECIARTEPDARGHSSNKQMWGAAHLCLAEVQLATNQPEAARDTVLRLRGQSPEQKGQELRPEAVRILALSEAKLGEPGAVPRITQLIEQQRELGVSGLRLGVTYEARAQIAIWQNDAAAFEEYAALTAHEYRYGAESALGARYDRLINEARRQGLQTSATLEHFASAGDSQLLTNDVRSSVRRSLLPTQSPEARMAAAVQLLCEMRHATEGQLYMREPDGLKLAAARGDMPELADLSALESFLERAEEHARQLDEMTTDELASNSKAPKPLLRLADRDVELLPLSTVVKTELRFIGVFVVPAGHGSVDEPRERQLLNTVAAQLVALDLRPPQS